MTASNMTAEINSATSNVSSFKDDLSVSELPSLFRKKRQPKTWKKASWADKKIYEMIDIICENENYRKLLIFINT